VKTRALHFPGETVKVLSPGGDSVATRSGSRIRLWDTTTGRLLRSFNGASTAVSDLAFSPDGKILLSSRESGLDGIMNAWPLRLGEEIASVRPSNSRGRRVLFDREGSRFYATAFRNIGAWGTRMGRPEWTFRSESRVFLDLAIHPTDGSVILSEGAKPAFTHVSSAGEPLDAFGTNLFSSVKFSRDGQLLLAVDNAFDATDPGATFRDGIPVGGAPAKDSAPKSPPAFRRLLPRRCRPRHCRPRRWDYRVGLEGGHAAAPDRRRADREHRLPRGKPRRPAPTGGPGRWIPEIRETTEASVATYLGEDGFRRYHTRAQFWLNQISP
jgi:hypothetical protein